jgi:hypothetical protein
MQYRRTGAIKKKLMHPEETPEGTRRTLKVSEDPEGPKRFLKVLEEEGH